MHQPVLLHEAIEALAIRPAGIYLDATFGRGGHSQAILQQLNADGRLVALDKDLSAVESGQLLQRQDPRFSIEHASFARLAQVAQKLAIYGQVDGILMDLGVSSPQLDEAERGFSFRHSGPLDMRMDRSQSQTAAIWLNQAPEQQIAHVLWEYGEERFSRRIARAIVQQRQRRPFATTTELADCIARAVIKKEKHKHPATRSFQAIRIFINQEMQELDQALAASVECLNVGGRLAIITFHSLEDRRVKRFLQQQVKGDDYPPHLPIIDAHLNRRFKIIIRKCKPSAREVQDNIRARSATLRVAEKIA